MTRKTEGYGVKKKPRPSHGRVQRAAASFLPITSAEPPPSAAAAPMPLIEEEFGHVLLFVLGSALWRRGGTRRARSSTNAP